MLTVTDAFKETIKQLTVQSDGYVNIINSSGTLTFDRDEITKIEIYGNAYQNDKVLGNLAQHSLTLELLGDYTKDISLIKENTVEVFLGVLVSGSYEYVQYQDFLITEITYSDTTNLTKIIATDNIVKLNKEIVDTNSYPMTLKAYTEWVLGQCGLSLENTTFLNSTFSVTTVPFSDYTNAKEIISRVAEMALSYVIVNKATNKIEFRNAFEEVPTANTHNVLSAFTHDQLSLYTHNQLMYGFATDLDNATKDNYWSFKLMDNNFGQNGINTLVLKISQVEGENNTQVNATNVAIDGNLEVSIADNPFINTEAKRLSIINAMFNVVDEFKYNPYSLEYRGFPYLEIGDIIIVEQMNEEEVAVPIYETNIKWNGGLLGKIGAKALSLTETKYRYISTTNQKIRNAEIMVDKANAEISLKVSEDEIISAINLSPEAIRINTAKLNIDAYVTFTNLSTSGQTTINGGNITTGTLNASMVTISNFGYSSLTGTKPPTDADNTTTTINGGIITTGTIQVLNGGTVSAGITGVGSGDSNVRFWAGSTYDNRASAPFRVTQGGSLVASNATISGTITSTSGTIGGFSLSSDNLQAGSGSVFVQLNGNTGGSYGLRVGSATGSGLITRYYAGNISSTDGGSNYPLYLNGSKMLVASNFSLSGTTLTISI